MQLNYYPPSTLLACFPNSPSHRTELHKQLTGFKCANVEFEEWTHTHTHTRTNTYRDTTAAQKTFVKLIMYTLVHTSHFCWSTWRFQFDKCESAVSVRTVKFPQFCFFAALFFFQTKIEVLCSREDEKKKPHSAQSNSFLYITTSYSFPLIYTDILYTPELSA